MIEIKAYLKDAKPAQVDLLRCIMMNLGIPAGDIVEKAERGRTVVSFYERSGTRAAGHMRRLRALKLKGVRFCPASIKDSGWTTRWKKYFKSFNINPDTRIVPARLRRSKIPSGFEPVYLDTTFAFGSGMHATTQLMAQFMHQKKGNLKSFLDIGTGSGILALIARRYGAGRIWALDIDPVSIKTARQNCRINKCRFQYLKAEKFERFRHKRRFDFVAANLLTEDLIRMKERIIAAARPGGYIAVSGIYRDNYPAFEKGFKSAKIARCSARCSKNWYAVLFKRLKQAPLAQ
jgi:ribosomal protein L11 methyltransferase